LNSIITQKSPDIKELYNPYPHQLPRHLSKAKYKYVMDPVRSGKDICLVGDNNIDVLEKKPIWECRPPTMKPKWNVWFVAETYKLLEQLWRDVSAYTPAEWFDSPPPDKIPQASPQMSLFNHMVTYSFRSAKNEAYLVAEGVDRINITEAGELPTSVIELLQSRMSSPDRFQTSSLFANGTPRGQIDPAKPTEDHWFWAAIMASRRGKKPNSEAWYWFEDRLNYGNLDHPILSRIPEGRAEIESKRHDPNLSERKFREDYLGECLPALMGDNAITDFIQSVHVRDDEFTPRYKLHRWWDFGRNYPAVTFHQFTDQGLWRVIGECAWVNADLTDEQLADRIKEYTNQNFRNVDGTALSKSQIYDVGDSEAKHREDSRIENTIEVLKQKGINLLIDPKRHGDEELAIDTLNARMKRNPQDGSPYMVVHPRCQMVIRCFSGMWIYRVRKMGDYETRESFIAEIHPWIDLFDTFKYGIVHTVIPEARKEEDQFAAAMITKTDPATGMTYQARE